MIAEIRGRVLSSSIDAVIIDVGGLGYLVHTTPEIALSLAEGAETHLYTYLVVRETALDLYGFTTNEERDFFAMLIGVSGIGPKSALAILGLADVTTLKSATAAGDISYLTKVSGIGKKNAEKIVLELRDKIGGGHGEKNGDMLQEEADVLDALAALGYSTREAREALKRIPKDIETSNERIKYALRELGNG